MNRSLTSEELRTHQHPLLPNPSDYRVVRYEVDLDSNAQFITSLVLTLRSASGEVLRLRFINPSIPDFGPFQIPLGFHEGSVYVVDTSFKGWNTHARIEVGSMSEDQPTFFFAQSVESVEP